MEEALEKLNESIEILRQLQRDSGSQEEYDKYERLVKHLNHTYDTLVLIGG